MASTSSSTDLSIRPQNALAVTNLAGNALHKLLSLVPLAEIEAWLGHKPVDAVYDALLTSMPKDVVSQFSKDPKNALAVTDLSGDSLRTLLASVPLSEITRWRAKKPVDFVYKDLLDNMPAGVVSDFIKSTIDKLFILGESIAGASYTQIVSMWWEFITEDFDSHDATVFTDALPPTSIDEINTEAFLQSLGCKIVRAHGYAGALATMEAHYEALIESHTGRQVRVWIYADYLDKEEFGDAVESYDYLTDTTWLAPDGAIEADSPCHHFRYRTPLLNANKDLDPKSLNLKTPTPSAASTPTGSVAPNVPAPVISQFIYGLPDEYTAPLASLPRQRGSLLLDYKRISVNHEENRSKLAVGLSHASRTLGLQNHPITAQTLNIVFGPTSYTWLDGTALLEWGIREKYLLQVVPAKVIIKERGKKDRADEGPKTAAQTKASKDLLPAKCTSRRTYNLPATAPIGVASAPPAPEKRRY